MTLRYLSAADLERALPMTEAIDVTRKAFAALSAGGGSVPLRTATHSGRGVTLLMGASFPELGLAAKIVSVFPGNRARGEPAIQGLVIVLDPETGAPLGWCDGAALTAIRTGAASGAATELLAREDARVGLVIGCGVQARTQVIAIDTVRELDRIAVIGRDPERVSAFVECNQCFVSAKLEAALDARRAVREADVLCLATSSATPVLDGADLQPGAHVNGVGSFTLEMQEADVVTVARARVFIDSLESALAEAGELVAAEAAGRTRRAEWTELGSLVNGTAAGRTSDEEITFFKSVGHAVQDVAAGTLALRNAARLAIGTEVA